MNDAMCPIHEGDSMRHFEKDGRDWWSHQVNGEWCNGKPKKAEQISWKPATAPITTAATRKHDMMLMCNAMNNATALVSSSVVDREELEDWFERILHALEKQNT